MYIPATYLHTYLPTYLHTYYLLTYLLLPTYTDLPALPTLPTSIYLLTYGTYKVKTYFSLLCVACCCGGFCVYILYSPYGE